MSNMNIGLTQRIFEIKGRLYDTIDHGWYSFLKDHTLTFIPNDINQNFNKIADSIDLLIITGGPDHTLRKQIETQMIMSVRKLDKPVLGVCNGAFLLTTLFGGNLILKAKKHHKGFNHQVFYKNEIHEVNSYHTNIISSPPEKTSVIVTDPDGDCEGFVGDGIAGVVWHPEQMEQPWLPSEINEFIVRA